MTQKDIHHRCFCTGQEFTFHEWCEYLRNKKNSNVAVHTFGKYRFNINDICKNPDTEIEYGQLNSICQFSIKVCQSDNLRWTYGYDYNFNHSGGVSGASYAAGNSHIVSYETKEEAVLACLSFLKNQARHALRNEKHGFVDDAGNIKRSSYSEKIKEAVLFIDEKAWIYELESLL